ncbi:MAG: hypothetical protein U0Q12_03175 [Vicinamibacterales bacterium]
MVEDFSKTASGHERHLARLALLGSLLLVWINFATTRRWADVPGALHGPKRWVFVEALVVATLFAVRPWQPSSTHRRMSHATCLVGVALLVVSFFIWFPPTTWAQIPFLDNWPARYQSTVDALALYRQGVAAGWEWHFLGGYHLSSDVTVTLSALAALPMTLLGPTVGFHALHFVLLLALPLLVYTDLAGGGDDQDTAGLAAGLTALTVTGWFSYFLVRSGDTNSLAGTACTLAALVGSHAAARGRRWGGPLLVLALALVTYSHAGFLVYTAILLLVESVFYRDRQRLIRATLAVAVGLVVGLPLTWEAWRYPSYFTFNNVALVMPPFAWEPFLRKVYYNTEILFLPWRWFNDFTGLANVFLPVILYMAWRCRTRAGFYAWAALTALVLLRFNTPEFGYAFLRPIHLLAIFPPVAIAGFLVTYGRSPLLTAAMVMLCAVYLQYLWMPVPHVPDARALDPALVDEIRPLDGAMVLVENTFHRDMDADLSRETERTPFAAHLEGLLVPATGKRFYAGVWDGWQWSPFRAHLMSGGAFKGQQLALVPHEAFARELRKWGIRHLLVWSDGANAYLAANSQFVMRWRHDHWTRYEFLDADSRDVGTPRGTGHLRDLTPLGGTVALADVRKGDRIVVRTNYYPAWTARVGDTAVALAPDEGQLAFDAPADGSYDVTLVYPRRYALTLLAVSALVAGLWTVDRARERRVVKHGPGTDGLRIEAGQAQSSE